MRYVMREKFWSLGTDFTIEDDRGNDAYRIDGKVFSFGDKLSFLDMDGREQALIDQKLLSWGPTYEIVRDDEVVAVVKKHLFSLFRTRFTVDVPGPDDLVAAGDFLGHDYDFTRHGARVARVSKRWLTVRDTYGIEIEEGEDDVLILASAVVIDLVCHTERDGEI